jgi:hypothetical protein
MGTTPMQTSFFDNIVNVTTPLSISGKAPDWYAGPQFRLLAPKRGFFDAWKAGEIDNDGYIREFNAQVLAQLDPADIYARLTAQYGADLTLLCYERPGEFCHRRLVAQWFEHALGIVVPELLL